MLWPDGRYPEHVDQFAELLQSGIAAARAVDPAIRSSSTNDKGRNNAAVREWLDT